MINHIMPPAEFIAPPNIRALTARNGDVHNFHYTPYLPTKRCIHFQNYYLWAERLWKFYVSYYERNT